MSAAAAVVEAAGEGLGGNPHVVVSVPLEAGVVLQLFENFFSELSSPQAAPPPKFQHSCEKNFSDSQPFAFSLVT